MTGRCHTVFTTTCDCHAVAAFDAGAADCLLKPIAADRLAQAVACLRERLRGGPAQRLRWLSAGVGDTIKMFAVDKVLSFQSDEKYTRVVTASDEAHVRKPLREIAEGLEPEDCWQVHRGAIVRASATARGQRDQLGRVTLHLRKRRETLAVSQAWARRFKPM